MSAQRPRAIAAAVAFASFASLLACRSAPPASPPAAGASDPLAHDKLAALLWFQTAEENRQLQRAVFRAAEAALGAALADPGWSALGQGEEARALPPAIVTDVDETVLDNSAYEAWRIRRGAAFAADEWDAWVAAAEARAIPGAVELLNRAAARGVTVFYVTNRAAAAEAATRANLRAAGFPLRDDVDDLLLLGERSDWVSDKESRRRFVAAGYRVLLLLGDDLNDFLSGVREASVERRAELAAAHADRFGSSWFVLPNPLYGSWERALGVGAPEAESAEAKRARLLGRLRSFR